MRCSMLIDHINPLDAKRLAIAAGARDVPWVMSFLFHCHDAADAERSLQALRANCPDRFRPVGGGPTRPPKARARR